MSCLICVMFFPNSTSQTANSLFVNIQNGNLPQRDHKAKPVFSAAVRVSQTIGERHVT